MGNRTSSKQRIEHMPISLLIKSPRLPETAFSTAPERSEMTQMDFFNGLLSKSQIVEVRKQPNFFASSLFRVGCLKHGPKLEVELVGDQSIIGMSDSVPERRLRTRTVGAPALPRGPAAPSTLIISCLPADRNEKPQGGRGTGPPAPTHTKQRGAKKMPDYEPDDCDFKSRPSFRMCELAATTPQPCQPQEQQSRRRLRHIDGDPAAWIAKSKGSRTDKLMFTGQRVDLINCPAAFKV